VEVKGGEEGNGSMLFLDKYMEKFPVPSSISSAAGSLPRHDLSLQGRTNLAEAQGAGRFPTAGLIFIQTKQLSILKKQRKMRSQASADPQASVASSWWCKQAWVQTFGHCCPL